MMHGEVALVLGLYQSAKCRFKVDTQGEQRLPSPQPSFPQAMHSVTIPEVGQVDIVIFLKQGFGTWAQWSHRLQATESGSWVIKSTNRNAS